MGSKQYRAPRPGCLNINLLLSYILTVGSQKLSLLYISPKFLGFVIVTLLILQAIIYPVFIM